MIIKKQKGKKEVPFGSLHPGDVFKLNRFIYMVIEENGLDRRNPFTSENLYTKAVELTNGEVFDNLDIPSETMVTPLPNAELRIED